MTTSNLKLDSDQLLQISLALSTRSRALESSVETQKACKRALIDEWTADDDLKLNGYMAEYFEIKELKTMVWQAERELNK